MPTPLQFHLDEHVSPAVAEGLRRRGIVVSTTEDTDLKGASDREQISFALSKRRVLVTHDRDFLRWHSLGTKHAGVAYCYQHKYSIGELVRILLLMKECLSQEEMDGTLEYL